VLTILTWFWTQPGGRAKYTPEHVLVWADMVKRNLAMPHRLAVVTDIAADYNGLEVIAPPGEFEDVRISSWSGTLPQCFRRLAMFGPDAGARFGERFVSMDLDCVVFGALDPLFDRPEDFVIYAGTSGARPYNGSMLMLTAGSRPQVYTDFTPAGAVEAGKKYLGSDQAWISFKLGPGEATWGRADGVYWRSRQPRPMDQGLPRLLFFPGNVKPWEVLDEPEIASRYRRNLGGRCLVLGYAPSVWDEALAALNTGTFDHVIASPEAAEHWDGPLHAVARSDHEADMLARLAGFGEVVFCGRTERRVA
jgi:hypothetical protein